MLVYESLDRFIMLNEDFLAENILNEKININSIVDRGKKLGVLASMFLIFANSKTSELNLPEKNLIVKELIIKNMSQENFLSKEEIFTGFKDLLNLYYQKGKLEKPKILYASKDLIDSINVIKPGFLDFSKIQQYNQYDDEILNVVEKLKSIGEKPNANLIKGIMLIETKMKPIKNKLGFEGFPQTKNYIIKSINKRNKTNFTMEDMYNPSKSAEFIHYYLKTIARSDYVKNLEDLIIAYNWGLGNLKKYKRGEEKLPKQTKDYINIIKVMRITP